jgi:hypothetical protein
VKVVGCAGGFLLGVVAGAFLFAAVEAIHPGTEDDFYSAAGGIPAAILFLITLALGMVGGILGVRRTRGQTVPTTVMLAGIPVTLDSLERLVADVEEPTASKLARAIEHKAVILNLNIQDRELLLRAMKDPPTGLEKLHAVLLREHTARARGDMA